MSKSFKVLVGIGCLLVATTNLAVASEYKCVVNIYLNGNTIIKTVTTADNMLASDIQNIAQKYQVYGTYNQSEVSGHTWTAQQCSDYFGLDGVKNCQSFSVAPSPLSTTISGYCGPVQ